MRLRFKYFDLKVILCFTIPSFWWLWQAYSAHWEDSLLPGSCSLASCATCVAVRGIRLTGRSGRWGSSLCFLYTPTMAMLMFFFCFQTSVLETQWRFKYLLSATFLLLFNFANLLLYCSTSLLLCSSAEEPVLWGFKKHFFCLLIENPNQSLLFKQELGILKFWPLEHLGALL